MKCNLQGLRSQLRKFDGNGKYVRGRHWEIANGGYDLYFQISYDGVSVLDCVCNELEPCADCENFDAIAKVVMEEYPQTRLAKEEDED